MMNSDRDVPELEDRCKNTVVAGQLNAEKPPEKDSTITFKIQWTDSRSHAVRNFESRVPFSPLEVSTENVDDPQKFHTAKEEKAPLEVFTPIFGQAYPNWYSKRQEGVSTPVPQTDFDSVTFKDIKISAVHRARLVIRHQPLLETIRKCIRYYPGEPLTGAEVEIHEPYSVLVHHMDNLEEAQSNPNLDDEILRHLTSLLNYLKKYMRPRINSVLKKLQNPRPSIAFDDLCLLYKPGSDVYLTSTLIPDMELGYVVMKTQLEPMEPSSPNSEMNFVLFVWYLEADGRFLGREWFTIAIPPYHGERQVTSLPAYPCRYLDNEDGGKTRQAIIDRGRKVYQIYRGMPKQMWYDGLPYSQQKQLYRGFCVLDPEGAFAVRSKKARSTPSNPPGNPFVARNSNFDDNLILELCLKHEITPQSPHSDMSGQLLSDFLFSSFHHINIATTESLPSDRHYFLITGFIPGFALDDKTWKAFIADSLTSVQPAGTMDSLIIDPINLSIVQAITQVKPNSINFDQISNKGEGHVILLHGPPGVGKTFTVECIAQSTGRPLISLTMGDLVHEEEEVDKELMKWFWLSERWKAIMLLDEADIFLERRATRDIQRNGIVSIFLRRMEYFRGLLFLTTNRVGQIDDAFLSRVSIVLQYDHLSDDTRKKIWRSLFQKLQDEAKTPGGQLVEVDKYAQKFVLNDLDVKGLQWNGREIRNALQTAISLATYKAVQLGQSSNDVVEVEEDHFRSVVSMSQKFKQHIGSITGQDEDQRARARMDRPIPGK